jgi:hypothetical protein
MSENKTAGLVDFDVTTPDGKTYTVAAPEGTPVSTIQRAAYAEHQKYLAEIEPAANSKEAFLGGAKRLWSSAKTGIMGLVDPDKAAAEGAEREQQIHERPGGSLEKLKDVYHQRGLPAAIYEGASQLPTTLAEQAPNLGAMYTGARVGAAVGSFGGPWGTAIGGVTGALVPSFFTQAGGNIARQHEENPDKPINARGAYGAAVLQAPVDVIETRVVVGKMFGIPIKAMGTELAERIAKDGLLKTIGKGTAKGLAVEPPGELLQQMLERQQAGLPLTDASAMKEYYETAYRTALASPLGTIGQLQKRGEARDIVATNAVVEQKRLEKEQEKIAEAARDQQEKEQQIEDIAGWNRIQEELGRQDAEGKPTPPPPPPPPAAAPVAEPAPPVETPQAAPTPTTPVEQPPAPVDIPAPVATSAPAAGGRYQEWLDKVATRMAKEGAAQEILDGMEENNVSVNGVTKTFWDKTYFNLPAQAQKIFRNYLAEHSGAGNNIDGDINSQVKNLDLPDEVQYLGGTERGFVALMSEANRRFAPGSTTTLAPAQTQQEINKQARVEENLRAQEEARIAREKRKEENRRAHREAAKVKKTFIAPDETGNVTVAPAESQAENAEKIAEINTALAQPKTPEVVKVVLRKARVVAQKINKSLPKETESEVGYGEESSAEDNAPGYGAEGINTVGEGDNTSLPVDIGGRAAEVAGAQEAVPGGLGSADMPISGSDVGVGEGTPGEQRPLNPFDTARMDPVYAKSFEDDEQDALVPRQTQESRTARATEVELAKQEAAANAEALKGVQQEWAKQNPNRPFSSLSPEDQNRAVSLYRQLTNPTQQTYAPHPTPDRGTMFTPKETELTKEEAARIEALLQSRLLGAKKKHAQVFTPTTAEKILAAFHKLFPRRYLKLKQPIIVDNVSSLPADIQAKLEAENPDAHAFVDPETGQDYYIADRIQDGDEIGLIVHERGGHAGLTRMIGEARVDALAGQISEWATGKKGKIEHAIAKEAKVLADASEETPGSARYNQELVAYFTELAINKYGIDPFASQPKELAGIVTWLRSLWQGVVAALKKLHMDPSTLTGEDIVSIVYAAARLDPLMASQANAGAIQASQKSIRLGATEGFKSWVHFAEQNKSADFGRIKTRDDAVAAAEKHYQEIKSTVPPFDGDKYIASLTEADIAAYPPKMQEYIKAHKAGERNQGIDNVLSAVAAQRAGSLSDWQQHLDTEYANDPFFRDYVMTGLHKVFGDNVKVAGVPFFASAIKSVHDKFSSGLENYVRFDNSYDVAKRQATADTTVLGDAENGWRKVPQTDETDPAYENRFKQVQAISCPSWCTSSANASYIRKGDFWVHMNSGKPSLAIRFEGDQVAEIQGPKNNDIIPYQEVGKVQELIDSGKIKLNDNAKYKVDRAVYSSKIIGQAMKAGMIDITAQFTESKQHTAPQAVFWNEKDKSAIYVGDIDALYAPPETFSLLKSASAVHVSGFVRGYETSFELNWGNLTTVGGDFALSNYDVADKLTAVGGKVLVVDPEDGYDTPSLPSLTSVGAFGSLEVETPKLVNENVGKEAALKGTPLAVEAPAAEKPAKKGLQASKAAGAPKYKQAPPNTFKQSVIKSWDSKKGTWGDLYTKLGLKFISGRYSMEKKALDRQMPEFNKQGVHRGDLISQMADNAVAIAHDALLLGRLVLEASGITRAAKSNNGSDILSLTAAWHETLAEATKKYGAEHAYDLLVKGWYGPRYASLAERNNKINAEIHALEQSKPKNWNKRVAQLEDEKIDISDWTPDDAADALLAQKEFGAGLDKMKKIRTDMRAPLMDVMVRSGLYTHAKAKEYMDNLDYVPMYRLSEDEVTEMDQIRTGRGLLGMGKEYKMHGSQKLVGDPIDNFSANMAWMMQRAIKNNAAIHSTKLLEEVGAGRWSDKKLTGKERGADKKPVHFVSVFKDGELQDFILDDANDMMAFAAPPIVTGTILDMMKGVSGILRHGVTMMPQFVVNQAWQDSMRAYLVGGNKNSNLLSMTKDTWVSIFNNQFKSPTEAAKTIRAFGMGGQRDTMDAEGLKNILDEKNQKGWRKGVFFFERLSHGSDLGAREAIFNAAKKELLAEGVSLELAESTAAIRANRYMPYQQVGTSISLAYLRAMAPFINPPIQGWARDIAALRGRLSGVSPAQGRKLIAFKLAKYAMMISAYTVFSSGSDDYERKTDDQRDDNFWLAGQKISVPQELRPFKVLIERMTRSMVINTGKGTGEIEDPEIIGRVFKKSFEIAFGLAPVPTLFKPVAEVAANFDIHSGNQLTSTHTAQESPMFQTNSTTSALAKLVGEALNIPGLSPIQIDHYLQGWLGLTGGAIGDFSNLLASDTGVPMHKWPIIGSIIAQNPHPGGDMEKFYDLQDKIKRAQADLKTLEERGDPKALKAFIKENAAYIDEDTVRTVGEISTALSEIRTAERTIGAMPKDVRPTKGEELEQLKVTKDKLLSSIVRIRARLHNANEKIRNR